jgi:hypothetical protein
MVYSLTPEYISAPILLIMLILFPISISLKNIFLWILFTILLIIFIGLAIYQIYLRTKYLSELQSISIIKSFLSIYILGFIGQIFLSIIIALILSFIFAIAFIIYFSFK